MKGAVGVLLAAGRAERFGSDKLLATLPHPQAGIAAGTPLAVAACRHLVAALPRTIAVVRENAPVLAAQLASAGARVVQCANADQGMSATLACGIAAANDAEAWVIALADMPWVRVDTICAVVDALSRGALIAAPYCNGARGHPVGFARPMHDALLALHGDQGARDILRSRASDVVRVDVDDPGILRDVDVPSDLADHAER